MAPIRESLFPGQIKPTPSRNHHESGRRATGAPLVQPQGKEGTAEAGVQVGDSAFCFMRMKGRVEHGGTRKDTLIPRRKLGGTFPAEALQPGAVSRVMRVLL